MDQLSRIFDVIGAPAPEEVSHIRGAQARTFLRAREGKLAVPFNELLPDADTDAASLLENLLLFDPGKRSTSAEALEHHYFEGVRRVRGALFVSRDAQITRVGRRVLFREVQGFWPMHPGRAIRGKGLWSIELARAFSSASTLPWLQTAAVFRAT